MPRGLLQRRRRDVLKMLGVAGAALSASDARADNAIEQPDFEICGVRDPQLGGQLAVADYYGFYKDEGIRPTIRWVQSSSDVLTIMPGGTIPVGTAGPLVQLLFTSKGVPIKAVSALSDISDAQGLVLSPGVRLSSPRELEGKRLANTQGTSLILLLTKLAKLHGFDAGKVRLVSMNQPEGIAAAAKGDVDGLLGWQPNLYRLIKLGGTMYCSGATTYFGGEPRKLPFEDRLQYIHSLLHVSESWIRQKPNTIKALLRALARASAILADDRPKAMVALQDRLRLDPEVLTAMLDANGYGLAISDSVARSLQFAADWAVSIGRLHEVIPPERCLAPELLAAVDPRLVTWKKPT